MSPSSRLTADRVRRLDPRNPTTVISNSVTTNPAPGMGSPNQPSTFVNTSQQTHTVTNSGASSTSPRTKKPSNRLIVVLTRSEPRR